MLTQQEKSRYARHLSLNQVGISGQEKLKKAKVLVIGAGGLGCPILQYLTAAGVGTIGIVDHDVVDESNLQRQILYGVDDIGSKKTEAAIQKLQKQNPYVSFIPHLEKLTTENALSVLKTYDIILDGTDNFPTRYLVNDSCIILNKPLVFGSIFKFEGQISVFNYQGGPSYRCLFPTPPKEGESPNCSEIGVLGILPGVVGTMMATECIKMIIGIGEVLSGKIQLIGLLGNQYLQFNITKNEENFKRKTLEKDYQEFCGIPKKNEMIEVTATDLKAKIEAGEEIKLIDVREDFEYEICHISGSTLIPLGEITSRHSEIAKEPQTVVICHHGMRSAQAIGYLERKGYNNLINLKGGIHAWAVEVDQTMQTY